MSPSGIAIIEDADRLAFEAVTLHGAQNGRPLVRELSLEVKAGARLLVKAPSEAIAALVRATEGLWKAGEGRIVRPARDRVLVVPERLYLPPGTLRELVGGIDGGPRASDDDLRTALGAVGIAEIEQRAGGFDNQLDRNSFSAEEMRLLGVVRVLVARPRFALLVRLESGVGVERAARVLAALTERGVGYIVLGGHESGRDQFDAVAEIASDGTWTLTPTKELPA